MKSRIDVILSCQLQRYLDIALPFPSLFSLILPLSYPFLRSFPRSTLRLYPFLLPFVLNNLCTQFPSLCTQYPESGLQPFEQDKAVITSRKIC